jgi:hypothetical protein
MKPTALNKEQLTKILKAALYLGISAALSGVISQIADNPDLFGPLTPVINVVLVTLKQVFTPNK